MLTVRSDPLSPERGQYAFMQTMLRDVAHDMLSRRERESRHRVVAAHLRSALPDDGADVAEVIAAHYLDAYRAAATDPDADKLRVPPLRARSTALANEPRGRWLADHDRSAEAEPLITEAIETFKRLSARPDLERVQPAQVEASRRRPRARVSSRPARCATAVLGRGGFDGVAAVPRCRVRSCVEWSARRLGRPWRDGAGDRGNSIYVVFLTADAAVAAATQAQRGLAGYPWPGGEQVRVRMGIHTSSPTPHDGGMWGWMYTGRARIAAAAHGGQVLLSEAIGRWWLSVCRSGLDGRRRQRPDPRPDRHGPELPSTLSTVARAKTVVGREPR